MITKTKSMYLILIILNVFIAKCMADENYYTGMAAFLNQDSATKQIIQADQCTKIENRLIRLNCFDVLFKTPIEDFNKKAADALPAAWVRATVGENRQSDGSVFELNTRVSGDTKSLWLTAKASNFAEAEAPILMLSCFDNISRVEIALPKPLKDARVSVTIPGRTKVTQNWISDDSGLLLRTGRGIPAVRVMKSMLTAQQLVLRSNSPVIDGLYFDASKLSKSIKPLRKACGW